MSDRSITQALSQPENIIMIIIILCLLVFSGFFSSSETALTAASRARMHAAEKDGDKRASIVARLLNMRERLLGGILLGNNLVNILASVLTTALFTNLFGAGGLALVSGNRGHDGLDFNFRGGPTQNLCDITARQISLDGCPTY